MKKNDTPNVEEKIAHFTDRATKIAKSFDHIKQDPMNLNILMAHIGFISLTIDELLRDYVVTLTQINEENNEKR
jgi:hypothetical protein